MKDKTFNFDKLSAEINDKLLVILANEKYITVERVWIVCQKRMV